MTFGLQQTSPACLDMASNSVNNIKTAAQNQHTEAMTLLFDSGECSDFTVKCGNRVWQLHRLILRSGSEYFKNACSGKFEVCLEGVQYPDQNNTDKWKEGCLGSIELKDEDPQYAGILLRFFYAHDYHIDDNGKSTLMAHACVYAIADKYGVGLLKDLAAAKFSLALENIRDADIPDLIAATEVVYTSTLGSDRGLRDCIKPKLIEFKQQLRDNDQFMALFMSDLGEGEFAVEVLDAWASLSQTMRP